MCGKEIMQKQNNRQVGREKETLAAAYLEVNGIRILECNFRIRSGEIDLVGTDGTYLIFFEVKYRRNLKFDSPLAAVNLKKQRNIFQVSDYYRLVKGVSRIKPVRYDVVGISGEDIIWVKNAFPYRGY